MHIEERLESIDTSLKAIVTILQSAGAITAVAGPAEARTSDTPVATTADTKKPRTTKKTDDAPKQDLVAGDPEGTRYWVSESTQTAYAQKPGDPDPKDQSFKIESSAHYLAKKAEFAKNASGAAAADQKPATTEPSATAQPDTASGDAPDWDTTFREIKALSTMAPPVGGRDAVLDLIEHCIPGAVTETTDAAGVLTRATKTTVPSLKDLGKNAEILAFIAARKAAPETDDLGL